MFKLRKIVGSDFLRVWKSSFNYFCECISSGLKWEFATIGKKLRKSWRDRNARKTWHLDFVESDIRWNVTEEMLKDCMNWIYKNIKESTLLRWLIEKN